MAERKSARLSNNPPTQALVEDWENLISWINQQPRVAGDALFDEEFEELQRSSEPQRRGQPQLTLEEFEVPQFTPTDTRRQKSEKFLRIVKRFLFYWIKTFLKNRAEQQFQHHHQEEVVPIEKGKRDDTTIAKVLFTQLKWRLLKERGCPVDMEQYFKVCDFKKNHRTLIDFEIPFWYVERLDQRQPGCLKAFRQYLQSKREEIAQHGRETYAAEPKRLETYLSYLNRIYAAYEEGTTSEQRIKILYGKKSFRMTKLLEGIMARLK